MASKPTFRQRLRSFTQEDWRAAIGGGDDPRVLMRRARLGIFVKIVLVLCVGVCVAAVVLRETHGNELAMSPSRVTMDSPAKKHETVAHETFRTRTHAGGVHWITLHKTRR